MRAAIHILFLVVVALLLSPVAGFKKVQRAPGTLAGWTSEYASEHHKQLEEETHELWKKHAPKGNERAISIFQDLVMQPRTMAHEGLAYRVVVKGEEVFMPLKDSLCEVEWRIKSMDNRFSVAGPGLDTHSGDLLIDNTTEFIRPMDGPIAAFEIALTRMVPGDSFEWYVPSNWAYGETGRNFVAEGDLQFTPVKPGDMVRLFIKLKSFEGKGKSIFHCNPANRATCDDTYLGWINLYNTYDSDEKYQAMMSLERRFFKAHPHMREDIAIRMSVLQQMDPIFDEVDVKSFYMDHLEEHIKIRQEHRQKREEKMKGYEF